MRAIVIQFADAKCGIRDPSKPDTARLYESDQFFGQVNVSFKAFHCVLQWIGLRLDCELQFEDFLPSEKVLARKKSRISVYLF